MKIDKLNPNIFFGLLKLAFLKSDHDLLTLKKKFSLIPPGFMRVKGLFTTMLINGVAVMEFKSVFLVFLDCKAEFKYTIH